MPVMDGWDFRRQQRADPALAAIPVIVLSADDRATRLASCPGVRKVLTKPMDFEELLGALASACAASSLTLGVHRA
jgi:CheY-like chemotaxis protein